MFKCNKDDSTYFTDIGACILCGTKLEKIPEFILTLDECKALNFFLRLHIGLLKEHPEHYTQLLRLINGIGQFVDKHNDK